MCQTKLLPMNLTKIIFLKRSEGGRRPTERSVFKFFFPKVGCFIDKILDLRWNSLGGENEGAVRARWEKSCIQKYRAPLFPPAKANWWCSAWLHSFQHVTSIRVIGVSISILNLDVSLLCAHLFIHAFLYALVRSFTRSALSSGYLGKSGHLHSLFLFTFLIFCYFWYFQANIYVKWRFGLGNMELRLLWSLWTILASEALQMVRLQLLQLLGKQFPS